MPPIGIYIHIPFCRQKCPYCDFYSVPFVEETACQYSEKIVSCLCCYPFPKKEVDTVYFGGGTPSILSPHLLEQIFSTVKQNFSLLPDAEITLEANPGSVTTQSLTALHKIGFNRLSFGVQSSSDAQLSILGRSHSVSDAVLSVQNGLKAGFTNISVDLMIATPTQTTQDIDRFISTFKEAGVSHFSAYLLKIEEGTPFFKDKTMLLCPDEDATAELYLHTVQAMKQAGFHQYEISNFSPMGMESRHNLKYWHCGEYLGLGPAAHSFLEGQRYGFPRDLSRFLKAENPYTLWEQGEKGGDLFERVMLGLRLSDGIADTQLMGEGFDCDDVAQIFKNAQTLPSHLLTATPNHITLTPEGFLMSNSVLTHLLRHL